MRAMQIIEWGKPLEARDYPDPEPQGTEVILRVEAAGVCHSDVHIWDGHFDLGAARDAYERLWTRERYDALTEILAGLPVNWRFFIKHKIFAAMEEKSRSGSVDGEGAALIHRVFRDIAGGYRELAIGR